MCSSWVSRWAVSCANLVFLFSQDVERDTLQPAIKGTTEILKSAQEHGPTIKRVIITSSFAALASSGHPTDHVYTEKDWNPVSQTYTRSGTWLIYFIEPDYIRLCGKEPTTGLFCIQSTC